MHLKFQTINIVNKTHLGMRKRNHPLKLKWLVLSLEHPIEGNFFLVNPQSPRVSDQPHLSPNNINTYIIKRIGFENHYK